MKEIKRYITRDRTEHKTHKIAISHCYTEAHLKLRDVLQAAQCKDAYKIAQTIIDQCADEEDKLTSTYYLLFNIVQSLKDILILNEED